MHLYQNKDWNGAKYPDSVRLALCTQRIPKTSMKYKTDTQVQNHNKLQQNTRSGDKTGSLNVQ